MRLIVKTSGPRHDDGFTLIELLVVIVILGAITIPLGNVLIGSLKNSDATTGPLALSHDAQISTAYFAGDVASVGMRDYTAAVDPDGDVPFQPSIQLNAAYNLAAKTCGTAATPAAIVRFLSDDWDPSGPSPVLGTDIVAYYLKPVGAVSELHRIKCLNTPTAVSDVILAHYVDPATVAVTCSSTCTAAAVPQQVTLAFSVTTPSVGPYPITLNGERRQTWTTP